MATIGKIEADQTDQLRNDLMQVASATRELVNRQQAIIQTLTQFQADMNNLAILLKETQDQIRTINRRQKNVSKRGGKVLDEEPKPIDTEPVS